MKRVGEYKFEDYIKNMLVEVDDGEGCLDTYEIDLIAWFIKDPDTNYYGVDDFHIDHVIKNGEYISFVKQGELPEKLLKAINNKLYDYL